MNASPDKEAIGDSDDSDGSKAIERAKYRLALPHMGRRLNLAP